MLSCSMWFSAPSFRMGGGLESRCVGRVYGGDGTVRVARHHPHRIETKLHKITCRHIYIYTFRVPICVTILFPRYTQEC